MVLASVGYGHLLSGIVICSQVLPGMVSNGQDWSGIVINGQALSFLINAQDNI